MIRRLAVTLPERVETGALQIGSDWPGLFVRGDDCIALEIIFEKVQAGAALSAFELGWLEQLQQTVARDVLGREREG